MPDAAAGRRGQGIYVHIPFCLRRCDYCDFTTFADRDEAIPAYVTALRTHIERTAGEWAPFSSVFVGGGTPTYLPADDLARILTALRRSFPFTEDAEWTVEANPETVTRAMAEALAAAGVTRISLGAQSFDSQVLSTLGRWHDPESVPTAVGRLRQAGIGQLSLDLIYGTPGETDASWQRSLDAVIDLGVTHVSAYALTVEPNTPYAARVRATPTLEPDEDVQAARMGAAEQRLTAAGLRRYEVSNWAVPGRESHHNLMYWRGGDWLAFGSGAHGSWGDRRWWLVRDPERYARLVAGGVEPLGGEEHVDAGGRRLERLMMGLRLVEGVERADVDPLDGDALRRVVDRGLVTADQHRLALTADGMALAGAVIRELA
ncbi:radical SAM family heme chaperone HemW [Euzebya sp.]|uniref:radical SAM family heme chaperone HemW n=1 Tax=Euzebya sp. TaxID=1971409 RepID=UPI0035138D04